MTANRVHMFRPATPPIRNRVQSHSLSLRPPAWDDVQEETIVPFSMILLQMRTAIKLNTIQRKIMPGYGVGGHPRFPAAERLYLLPEAGPVGGCEAAGEMSMRCWSDCGDENIPPVLYDAVVTTILAAADSFDKETASRAVSRLR